MQQSARNIRVMPITAGVRIEIPAPRRWPQAFGIGIWLFIWVSGILSALADHGDRLGRDPLSEVGIFALFGLGVAAFGAVSLLREVAGREVLEVDARYFRVGTEIPVFGRGLGRAKVYNRAAVRNLRYEPEGPTPAIPGPSGGSAASPGSAGSAGSAASWLSRSVRGWARTSTRTARSPHGAARRKVPLNLCFDCGKETVRFGQGVSAADAVQIIAAVNARFPVPRA